MAIATTDADTDAAQFDANAAPSLAFPTSVAVGDFLLLGVYDRADETTTISGVAGTINTTGWTLIDGPVDHPDSTQRIWWYYKISEGSGTETVTVTFSGSVNSYLLVSKITGVDTSDPIDVLGTTLQGFGTTNFDSNSLTAAGAGAILGLVSTQSSMNITADGSGETDVSNESSRIHLVYEPYASGGSKSLEITGEFNSTFTTMIVALNEASAGLSLAVDHGQMALESQSVNLVATDALVIPVASADYAMEGQEIPFILGQPGTEGQMALEGQQVTLLTQAIIDVVAAEYALQGDVTLLAAGSIDVVAGQMALDGRVVDLVATGIASSGDGGMVYRRRRRG